MKIFNKRNLKIILTALLGIGLVVGVATLIKNLVNKEDDGLKEIHPSYQLGGIDENGNFVETKESFVTKNAISLEGLSEVYFELAFDNNIDVTLFVYDEFGDFEGSEEITKKFTYTVQDENYSLRLMITPEYEKDAEREISLLQIGKYANQLTVSVKEKSQKEILTLTIKSNVDGYEDITIEYEEGMTWYEWFNSEYNDTILTVCDGNGNMITNESIVVAIFKDGQLLMSDLVIDSNHNYTLDTGSF